MRILIRRYAIYSASLLAVFVAGYLVLMCREWSVVAVVDAFNYSLQTITTVGYGNWGSDEPCNAKDGLFWMKLFSVFAMPLGAAVFALTIGLIAEWVTGQA